uniref:Uncharacterized protein n=1 Tax=Triticum urartu TaxID=4572 RepID=A0A8R7P5J5_TRIUA
LARGDGRVRRSPPWQLILAAVASLASSDGVSVRALDPRGVVPEETELAVLLLFNVNKGMADEDNRVPAPTGNWHSRCNMRRWTG